MMIQLQVLDRESQMDNPNPQWLADSSWDNITELAKLANFHGIIESFEQYPRDWHQWFQASEPENTAMPGEWDSVNELQKMLIVRSLRSDREKRHRERSPNAPHSSERRAASAVPRRSGEQFDR